MGRPKRDMRAAAEEATTPPDRLTETQSLAKVIKAESNSLYFCSLPSQRAVLVELASRFHNTVLIRRGGFVLVELASSKEHDRKVEGEIINIVGDEKQWRKQSYWPKEFPRITYDDDDDEDSTTGKMPPSDSDED